MKQRQFTFSLLLAAMLLAPQWVQAIELELTSAVRYSGQTANPNPSGVCDEQVAFRCSFTGGRIEEKFENRDTWTYDWDGKPQEPGVTERVYHATIRPGERIKAFVGDVKQLITYDDENKKYGYRAEIYIYCRNPQSANKQGNGRPWEKYVVKDSVVGKSPSAQLSYTVDSELKEFYVRIFLAKRCRRTWGEQDWYTMTKCDIRIEYKIEETDMASNDDDDNMDDDDDDDDDDDYYEDDDGAYYEEEDIASGSTGFWDYAIPIGVVIVLLGGAAAISSGGNKPEDDKDQRPDRLEMRIYKNFGNTISPAYGKYPIFACIVRIPSGGGEEITDEALTAQIQITGDDYLRVTGHRMENEWKCADVEAPEQANVPEKATVTFSLTNDKGGYVNHVQFYIQPGEVLFGQNNLTLPSGYKKEVRLPFVVVGRDGQKDITASIVPVGGSDSKLSGTYDVQVEWNEKEQMHYAVITDLKQEDPLDRKPSADVAGKYEQFRLEVEAPNKYGEPIRGALEFYRYHMGLSLKVGNIGCYIEEYNSAKHLTNKFAATGQDGKTYVPAETKGSLILYEYDEENHKILTLAPVLTSYKISAIDEKKQDLVEKIALQCELTNDGGKDGGRLAVFRCCRATLDAPSRIEAKMELIAKHGEREYKLEKKVLLCSQPVRHFGSVDAEMAAIKEDERIGERLIHIQSAIFERGLYSKLFPLEKYIGVMLDGYHADYGYDPAQVKRVRDLYTGVLSGRIEGANGEGAKPMTLAEEVGLFLTVFIENSKKVEESLGFFGRLAVGVCTLGCSEVVFTGLEVVTNMKEYVDKGGDSVWGGFCVGAKVVVREYITEKLMAKGMEKIGKVAKEAGLTPDALKKAGKEMMEEGKGYLTTLKGKIMKNAINQSDDAARIAAAEGQTLSKMVSTKPLSQAEKQLLEASEFGLAHAKEQVRDLQAAIDLYRMNPHGVGNKEMMNKLILEVQQNKQAMYLLKKADSSMDYVRSKFNTTLQTIYENTDDVVMDKLSKGTGVPRHKIKKLNATTSEQMQLIKGKKVTMDRDVTYYWTDDNGVDHYFSQKNTQAIYNNEFYEQTLGYRSKVDGAPGRFAQSMDQTNIEDVLNHPESYGVDLDNMLKPELHKQALLHPDKVADTVTYKGKEWFRRGEELMNKSKNIADLTERQLMESNAVSSMMEGLRQEVKQFDNFVNPRNIARFDVNGVNKIPKKLRIAVDKARKITDMDSPKALVQIKRELEALGYTLDSFAEAMGQAIKDIG